MSTLYRFTDYRDFMETELRQRPRRGFGQLGRLAKHLKVHPTLVSQVFRRRKDFSLEQAALTASFFGLSEKDTDYFLTQVQYQRAGNAALREIFQRRLDEHRQRYPGMESQARAGHRMAEQEAVFYSDWSFAAIRQILATKPGMTVAALTERLALPAEEITRALAFLVRQGLVVAAGKGYRIGPASTHLSSQSPWVRVHHINWRQRAIERMSHRGRDDLFTTTPCTLSHGDFRRVRETLMDCLKAIYARIDDSPSQQAACLNIDWFMF
jgi:uncharacterized protein (TIGR02147 family)